MTGDGGAQRCSLANSHRGYSQNTIAGRMGRAFVKDGAGVITRHCALEERWAASARPQSDWV